MKRSIPRNLLLLALFSLFTVAVLSQEPRRLVVLHTNDMHSRLDGFSPSSAYSPETLNDDQTRGGFSRLANILKREQMKDPEHTLTVDAGDFLMGTFYHYMEEYNGFQIPLMSQLGYEVVAIGNHEFDYGSVKLGQIIDISSQNGPIPQLLLGNVVFSENETGDDKLESLFNSGIISRTTIIDKDGLKIGLFSLMGVDADEVAPFAPPVTFSKQKKAAKRMVKELRAKGCDLIICLSHSGIEKNKKGEWSGEDVKLARKVKGLDIIVSGHTHTRLEEPLMVKGVPIVQSGSYAMNVGRLEVEITDDGINVVNYSLIPVDDSVLGDPVIQSKIEAQREIISAKLLEPMGFMLDSVMLESDYELICDEYGGDLENSNLGPLVADAIYKYVNNHSPRGTDISMVAAGVIRDRLVPGKLTVQDIFRVMSLGSGADSIPGYPLATVYITGKELKSVVEILLVAYKSSPSNFCYYSGLEVSFNPDKGMLRKVNSIWITQKDGSRELVDFSKDNHKLFSLTANSYMLEFIGIIKKMTFGLVNVVPKDINGIDMSDMKKSIIDFNTEIVGVQEGKEWIALAELLSSMSDTDFNSVPNLDKYYEKPPLRVVPQK